MTGSRADAEHVVDLLGPAAGVGVKRFFGGWSLIRGRDQVGIVMDTVYAKVAPPDRDRWREAGCHPFRYEARGSTVTVEAYWSVPDAALDDRDLLADLLLHAADPTPEVPDHDRDHARNVVDRLALWPMAGDEWATVAATCLDPAVRYCDPNVDLPDREALAAYMDGFRQARPGHSFRIDATFSHHDRSVAHWSQIDPGGARVSGGTSCAEHAPDGLLASITGFFHD